MKTAEQEACDYAQEWQCAVCYKQTYVNCKDMGRGCLAASARYADFLAGVKWAERWIPVEDELPENSMRVIVCTQLPNGARLITGGWYGRELGEMGWNVDIDNWPGLEVVGWRPIEHK